jgi:protein SCO1
VDKAGMRSLALLCILSVALALAVAGCQRQSEQLPPGVFDSASDGDCLPAAALVDQHGNAVNFAGLKGKWLLVDFIYTRCPGTCELMTAKLARAADHLGAALGKNVEIVSITLDPEHDGPKQLSDWARAQSAQRKGWLFLTGPLQNVEQVMAAFKVKRAVEPDGTIDHVTEFFLVGPNGRERRQYSANEATPEAVANDVMTLASLK